MEDELAVFRGLMIGAGMGLLLWMMIIQFMIEVVLRWNGQQS
jgi:hypothetical protein